MASVDYLGYRILVTDAMCKESTSDPDSLVFGGQPFRCASSAQEVLVQTGAKLNLEPHTLILEVPRNSESVCECSS